MNTRQVVYVGDAEVPLSERQGEVIACSLSLEKYAKGYMLAAWVCRITGVSRAAMSRAISEGRVRCVVLELPGGADVELVNPEDAANVGNAYGWQARRKRSRYVRDMQAKLPPVKPAKKPRKR